MKKYIYIFSLMFLLAPFLVYAHGNTAAEEARGKTVWENMQMKTMSCENLSNENFTDLGEYFMGTMLGSSHEQMNELMEQMMGAEGEEQMHMVMGRRMSGCDTAAAYPSQGFGFMPMMQMMGGMMGWAGTRTSNQYEWGWSSNWTVATMVLTWILLALGIVAVLKWLFWRK